MYRIVWVEVGLRPSYGAQGAGTQAGWTYLGLI